MKNLLIMLTAVTFLLYAGGPAIAQVNDCSATFNVQVPSRYIIDEDCDSDAGNGLPLGLEIKYDVTYRVQGSQNWVDIETVTSTTDVMELPYVATELPCGVTLEFVVTSHWPGEPALCYSNILLVSTVRPPPGKPILTLP